MKTKQASFTKRALVAGLIAGGGVLAVSAWAVSGDDTAGKPRCEAKYGPKGEAGWGERRAAHLAALKDKLKLAPDQEAAWASFAESAQAGPRHQDKDRKAMREEFATLSTPERLDRMQAMAEMRRARMAERAEAIKAFYAQLSPEQQRVFDAEAMPNQPRGHHHHHRHAS